MKGWLAAASVVAALVVGVSVAQADPPPSSDVEEARKHYTRGVELYEQRADAAALAELERAYELAPNWKVLYELAVVELAVHDFVAALNYFERYLAEGGDAIGGARQRAVTDQIARLEQEVATVEIVATPGAEIRLDDVTVATAPLAKPLVVNPGHHKIGASKDGVTAESRPISVTGGDHTRIEIEVAPPPAPPPPAPTRPTEPTPPLALALPAPPRPPPEPPPPARAHVPWTGWAVTGALAAGAIATGLEALSANGELTSAKTTAPATAETLSTLSSRAHAFALACDVLTGAAVVAGGVTLYFTLRSPSRPQPAVTALSLGVGLGNLSLRARF